MTTRASRRAGAALLAAAVLLLAAPANAGVSRVVKLRQTERHLVRLIEKEKTTLRFFENRAHAHLLYSPNAKVKRKAWHAVAVARQRIIRSRVALARVRVALDAARVPPHLALWRCIHGKEASWTDHASNNPHYGGLQLGDWFMRTYAPDLLARLGTADYWTPMQQMWVAENAYQREHYSLSWLRGQWRTSYGCV